MIDPGVAPTALRMPISSRPLLHRDHHDVGNADHARQERADADDPDEEPDPAHQVDEPLELDQRVGDEDRALVLRIEVVALGELVRARRSAMALLSSTAASPTVIMIMLTRLAPPKARCAVEIGR